MTNSLHTATDILQKAESIVIKVGSVLIHDKERDTVNQPWMNTLAQDISRLMEKGKKVTIVSSGGIALGRRALDISSKIAPDEIPLQQKQAASAVGQFHLFNGYYKAFKEYGITAAQVLLTMGETENRRMNLNARETLHTLLAKGIVPIINENDTVSTGEIRFGDNDRLGVRVAQMILADTVVLLSTTDGLYTKNPDKHKGAKHIPLIKDITKDHIRMAGKAVPGLSTGGMKSKIEAAQSAVKSGIHMIIAKGTKDHIVKNLYADDQERTTLFMAENDSPTARKVWIQAHMSPKGAYIVDAGALKALTSGKNSLLPVGVAEVQGNFSRGDVVEIKTQDGNKIGLGLSAYNAEDAKKIIGHQSQDIQKILGYVGRKALIHHDDIVLES
jgi:glutamate 5-kinase